ncbi:two-component sensor histidine kinase [Archangium violaceum]|uniref:sensor histidine kinase n=1 Tax=Archangium violaceum TaxID=83451 RepID=UPI0019501B59|nr:ATP-binding protein [Archangium violaceum]QRN96455.1 two-component sensor histidine kinase [Archangium violaceum]
MLQDEQKLLYMLALVCLPFWVVDSLSVMRPTWDTLALRAVWGGLTGVMAWSLSRVSPERRQVVLTLAGVVLPNVFFGLVLSRVGGVNSPLFGWLCVLPVVSLSISRGALGLGVLSTLFPMVSAGVVMWLSGTSAPLMATWLLLLLGAGGMGMLLSSFYRRVGNARVRAEAERLAAKEALVASQTRVLEAERLAQVGRLAAGVAHEVKNPLAYIQANLRFLQEEWQQVAPGVGTAEYTEALQETMQGVERIHQIVKDLTAMSRAEGVEGVGRCELAPILDASVRLASVRLKSLVKLAVEEPPAQMAVRAEPRRLGQVLLNLLLNAADAIEDAKVLDGQVAVRVETVAERVRLVVEDNGPGMKPEHLAKLFTPFFTTKEQGKGTGLGLTLSRQYVESFGGQLSAENRPEGGARFIVDLPVA